METGTADPKSSIRDGADGDDDRLHFGAADDAQAVGAQQDPDNLWAFYANRWLSTAAAPPAGLATALPMTEGDVTIIGQPDGDLPDDGMTR